MTSGARKFGCDIAAIAPGRQAHPLHDHQMNDAVFPVREGESLNGREGE
ncbi:hypothetical protein ACFFJ7_19255 [Pseudochelatococcus lubricantis]